MLVVGCYSLYAPISPYVKLCGLCGLPINLVGKSTHLRTSTQLKRSTWPNEIFLWLKIAHLILQDWQEIPRIHTIQHGGLWVHIMSSTLILMSFLRVGTRVWENLKTNKCFNVAVTVQYNNLLGTDASTYFQKLRPTYDGNKVWVGRGYSPSAEIVSLRHWLAQRHSHRGRPWKCQFSGGQN